MLARKLHDAEFIVENDSKKLMGLLSLHDLEMEEEIEHDIKHLEKILVAGELLHDKFSYVTPKDTLFKAMQLLANTDFGKVPVVDETHVQSRLLGYLTRRDILKFYNSLGGEKTPATVTR